MTTTGWDERSRWHSQARPGLPGPAGVAKATASGSAIQIALATLMGSSALALLPNPAFAACVNIGGTTWECSASNAAGQSVNQSNANVVASPGFSVNTADTSALYITGAGSLNYFDNENSSLTGDVFGLNMYVFDHDGATAASITAMTSGNLHGRVYGLVARNERTGPISVTTTGHVEGVERDGIFAVLSNVPAGLVVNADLTINANSARGGLSGIRVENDGTGISSVTATGLVEGGETGIYVVNGDAATDVLINAASVSGGQHGIYSQNNGIGETSVTATGHVESDGTGIRAENAATAGALTVETQSVSGGETGIHVRNQSAGETLIRAAGPVVGITDVGIFVTGPGNLTVEAGDVTGGSIGIRGFNLGTGNLYINSSGAVAGGDIGIEGYIFLASDLQIDAVDVSGGDFGIHAQGQSDSQLRINTTGHVQGGHTGIVAQINSGRGIIIRANSVTGVTNNGISVSNAGEAADIVATGHVSGSNRGIYVFNGAATTDVLISAVSVSGGDLGIDAANGGTGNTAITTTGHVEGGGIGIRAENAATADALTVETQSVSGGETGIHVRNHSAGETVVRAAGPVVGTTDIGISATARGDLTVEAGDVTGGSVGIMGSNLGTGNLYISASGAVVGGDTGIDGFIFFASDLQIDAVDVSGGDIGVYARGQSDSQLRINTTGQVQGGNTGISAQIDSGRGIIIRANSVTGVNNNGISVSNVGEAADIVATGHVSGGNRGINVVNGGAATDVLIDAASVSGGQHGIYAQNHGSGVTSVTAGGNVAGGEYGIYASNSASATDLTVAAASASGDYAIRTENAGMGATSVTVSGLAEGDDYGIFAFNHASATNLSIEVANANGGLRGIRANNFGTGETSVVVTGLAEGGTSAIVASSVAGQRIEIANNGGLIRNRSGISSHLAVDTSEGFTILSNNGVIVGTVSFGDEADTFSNMGTWVVAGGTNDFGGGGDQFVNQANGVFIGAIDGTRAETTVFNGLASFANSGLVSLIDGGTGDVLRTDGDAGFAAGAATLAVDLDSAGGSDLFIADGNISLINGPTLEVNVIDGLRYGHRYTVMTAGGVLDGTFGVLEGVTSTAFLTVEDTYDASNAYLDVIQNRAFADAGSTPNQIATAQGLDSLPGGVLFEAVVNLPDDAAAQRAFDRLSGEIHASAAGALVQDSRILRDAVTNRIRTAFSSVTPSFVPVLGYGANGPEIEMPDPELFALWGQASGGWGHRDGDGNAAGIDADARHFVAGADGFLGDWRLGLLAGYSHTGFAATDRASSGTADSYHLGLYGGTDWNNLAFRTGFIHSWHNVTTTRTAAFPGFAETLSADYGARTAQLFGELAYGIDTELARIEPFANLAYVRHKTQGYTETGGAAALSSARSVMETTFTTIGVRAESELALGTVDARVRGMVGWQHAFGDVTPLATHAFAGGSAFTVAGTPIARDAALVELGLDLSLTPTATLGLSYDGQFASGATNHGFRANLGVKF